MWEAQVVEILSDGESYSFCFELQTMLYTLTYNKTDSTISIIVGLQQNDYTLPENLVTINNNEPIKYNSSEKLIIGQAYYQFYNTINNYKLCRTAVTNTELSLDAYLLYSFSAIPSDKTTEVAYMTALEIKCKSSTD